MSFLDKLFKKKESVENKAKDAANKAENAAKDAAAKVDNAAKNVAAKVDNAVKGAAEDAKQTVVPGSVEKVIHEPKFADLGDLLPGAPAGGKINLAIYWAAACG